ncbi:unnamed protein product [Blepharisma stoltei]|uniref:Uncharacterized protein n=1 Tax=Blepharisma stoltei TaxID=1481888 RepID=A0AAU9KGH7_9CILI|nr:unnamed protein product [Blepharisma stoltei]
MGACACIDKGTVFEKPTIKEYRGKMVIEYLYGLSNHKTANKYDDTSEEWSTKETKGWLISEGYNVPPGLIAGDIFIIDDGSHFEIIELLNNEKKAITHCLVCDIDVPGSELKNHSNSTDHFTRNLNNLSR